MTILKDQHIAEGRGGHWLAAFSVVGLDERFENSLCVPASPRLRRVYRGVGQRMEEDGTAERIG